MCKLVHEGGTSQTTTAITASQPMPIWRWVLRPRRWPILGQVHADARLLYATTAGKVHFLKRSKALEDYAAVVKRPGEVAPWLKERWAA